ncbi:MAG: manganese ABC transporter ATP-binding protein, partial [Fimbriimonadaceae bacterium]|nr:manganese ABC transporter ATP-binding protein [Fimbriimonadaceae bacterium]
TVVAVHHDLQTVADYFDDVALVNLRVFGVGPVAETMTPERLRQTYGGRLGALETIAKSATGAAS